MLKEISVILPQVLYHMFEAYVEMGAENVGASEVAKGFASFAVVAIGGTIIGISKGHLRCILISARLREPTTLVYYGNNLTTLLSISCEACELPCKTY